MHSAQMLSQPNLSCTHCNNSQLPAAKAARCELAPLQRGVTGRRAHRLHRAELLARDRLLLVHVLGGLAERRLELLHPPLEARLLACQLHRTTNFDDLTCGLRGGASGGMSGQLGWWEQKSWLQEGEDMQLRARCMRGFSHVRLRA